MESLGRGEGSFRQNDTIGIYSTTPESILLICYTGVHCAGVVP